MGDLGSIPGLGRSPEGGHGNPLQYSCLENPMDRGAWHGVARSPETTERLSTGGTSGKDPACQCKIIKRCRFNPWVKKIPWRRAWQSTPVFLLGESHGQRRLADYSPQGRNELNMTEVTLYTIFIVAAPFYSPTKNLGGFNFLHILTSICYCLFILAI